MRFDDYMERALNESPLDTMVGNVVVKPSSHDARLVRQCIIEEMQAVNDYIERAEKCENDAVRKLLLDIAEEERVHFGEFEMMLEAIDPLHEPSEEEGEDEMEDMFGDGESEDGYEDYDE